MDPTPFVERLLDDEGLTAGLADPEARVLVRGLVARLERDLAASADANDADRCLRAVRERGRKIARYVVALCYAADPAETRRLGSEWDPAWKPDPTEPIDPVALVARLIDSGE